MFKGITDYANYVDFTMAYIFGFSIIMLILVTSAMIFFVIKYHHTKHPNPKQTHGSTLLELTWTIIPTIIVLSMFYVGYADFSNSRDIDRKDADVNIKVFAKQFNWDFQYENGLDLDTLYVPVNKTTKFVMSSYDVLHSFYIPAMRIKQDCVPSKSAFFTIKPLKTGAYDIACAEYCGVRHWNMYTKIHVLSEADYSNWYNSETKKLEDLAKPKTSTDSTSTKDSVENAEVKTQS